MASKLQSMIDDISEACAKWHANITGSEDGETVSVLVRFEPGNKAQYTDAETAVNNIIARVPRPRAGSVWGNDGGSVGGAVGLENGYLRLTASGCDKRLAKALHAKADELQYADVWSGAAEKAAGQSKRGPYSKRAKAEVAKAEEFIDAAVETAVKRKGKEITCTADDIVRERDEKGLSWAQVAVNLDLGSPGAARRAYTQLTGKPHNESVMTGKRAARGSKILGGNKKTHSPEWNDDSDQDEIAEKLNGEWVPEAGSGKDYRPAHWAGSNITVRRKYRGTDEHYDEEVQVGRCISFTFGKNGDQPLQVNVSDRNTGATRCFFVADIIDVR